MEDLISGIYKITNPEGRIYIGCSKNIVKRKYYYKNNKLTHQSLIRESIIKFGWGNHIFEIIEECSVENLDNREIYWGLLYNVLNVNFFKFVKFSIGFIVWLNENPNVKFSIHNRIISDLV